MSLTLSVVTPAYNQASFIRETIDSVRSQDYSDIEYYVLNDGSTDETEEVLRSYGPSLAWTTHTNRGQTATINAGWERSTGDVITWLNSDDTFLPGAVRIGMEYLRDHPDVDIVYGTTVFTDTSGNRLPQPPAGSSFEYTEFVRRCHNPIPQPSAFIRRKVLDDIGFLDTKYYYFMDWDYWLRAGLRHKVVHVDVPLSTYRLHAESKTIAGMVRAAPELEYMYGKFFSQRDLPDNIRALENEAFANMWLASANYFVTGGHSAGARAAGWRALRRRPSLLFSPRGLHQLAFCALGTSRPYRWLASLTKRSA